MRILLFSYIRRKITNQFLNKDKGLKIVCGYALIIDELTLFDETQL